MKDQHLITPPPELFAEWLAEAKRMHPAESTDFIAGEIARLAYRAGADQELEACCEWLNGGSKIDYDTARLLRSARRPKPPSLKEQALHALGSPTKIGESRVIEHRDHDLLRRALEALPDD